MRTRRVTRVAALAVLCSACAAGSELRVHAERHAPIVPVHVARPLGPAVGYLLVDPRACLSITTGCSGSAGAGCVVLLVGCMGLTGAVDLVALPVQVIRRERQERYLEAVGLSCLLDDPAPRVASELAARMVQEFGFSPAPALDPNGPMAWTADERAARNAVLLRVTTIGFEISSGIAWKSEIELRAPDDELLWSWSCEGNAPERAVTASTDECVAARGDVVALADRCVDSTLLRLGELWPGWGSEPAAYGRSGSADELGR